MGIFGTSERLGKPAQSDIVEGKITLLVSRALRDGTPEQQARIKTILALGDTLTDADSKEFQRLIEITGAKESAQQLAQTYIAEGLQSLEKIREKLDPQTYTFLVSVAEYMLKRAY